MLDYADVITSSNAYKIMEMDIVGERLSHTYLFVSVDQNYLKNFANIICTKLIASESNYENVSNRIQKRLHPDVKVYGEEKNIDTQTVSEIVDASGFSPFEADKKIFVLSNVQNMNEASQNKILKTIEEPPANTFFILTATSCSKILQTILSRSKKIELDNLSDESIAKMLEKKGVMSDKALIFSSCAQGNGILAEKLATDENFIEFYNQSINCLYEINGSRDVLKFSSVISGKNIDKNEFFDIMIVALRDVLCINFGQEQLVKSKTELSKLKLVASMIVPKYITELISKCLECKSKLDRNVNSTAVVDEFLFKLAEVKVKCRRL